LSLLKKKYPDYYFYQGRKISKKISPSQKNLIKSTYHTYSLDESIIEFHQNKNLKKKIFFPKKYQKINIEIGFGNGDFLVKNAISNPEELFIGIEVYMNGIAKVLKAIIDFKLENIILSNLNSIHFLKAIHSNTIDKIFIINPDPWIKKRHKKRRLISYDVINLMTSITKSKNSIYMTTDSVSYLNHTKSLLIENNDLFGDFRVITLTKNDELYGISRYQKKAIEKGRKIYLLKF